MPTSEVDPPRGQPPARSRISIAGMMLAVAVASLILAPLASPSERWVAAFTYIRIGTLIVATFLARFAPAKGPGWWFGFATIGWVLFALNAEGLKPGTPGLVVILGVDLYWPGDGPGILLARLLNGGVPTYQTPDLTRTAISVVSFWLAMAGSAVGGLVGLALDRRRQVRLHSPG